MMPAAELPEQLLRPMSDQQADAAALQSSQANEQPMLEVKRQLQGVAEEQHRQSDDVAALRSQLTALAGQVAELTAPEAAKGWAHADARPAWTTRYKEALAGAGLENGYDSDSEKSDSGPCAAVADMTVRMEKLDKQLETIRVEWEVARWKEAKKWESFERSVEGLREALKQSQKTVPAAVKEEISQRCRMEVVDAHLDVSTQLADLSRRVESLAPGLQERAEKDSLGSLARKVSQQADSVSTETSTPELTERGASKGALKEASLCSTRRPSSVLSVTEHTRSVSTDVSLNLADFSRFSVSRGPATARDSTSERPSDRAGDRWGDRPSDRSSDEPAGGSADAAPEVGSLATRRFTPRLLSNPPAFEERVRPTRDRSAAAPSTRSPSEDWDFMRTWKQRKPAWSLLDLTNTGPAQGGSGPWSRMLAS